MEDEEILIKITTDTAQAKKEITSLTTSIEGTKEATKELETENKRLAKSGKTNSKQYRENAELIALNKSELGGLNQQRKRAIQVVNSQKGSLTQMRVEVAKLTATRNQDLVVGSKAFTQANKEINALSASIKSAEEGGGDYRRSVGNYTKATDKFGDSVSAVNPAMGGMIKGFQGMVKGALAFIATPIGAIIAALVIVFKLVQTYMSRTEEGGDKLAVAMGFLGGIFEGLLDVVSSVGKLLFDVFVTGFKVVVNNFKIQAAAMKSVILAIDVAWQKAFGSQEEYIKSQEKLKKNNDEIVRLAKEQKDLVVQGAKDLVKNGKEVIKTAGKTKESGERTAEVARIQNRLNKAIRINTVEEARRRQEIQKNILTTRDFTKSFEVREKALLKANALEKESLKAKLKIGQIEVELARERDDINDSGATAKQDLADAEAKFIRIKTDSFAKQRELQNRITEQNNREAAVNKKIKADKLKADEIIIQSKKDVARVEKEIVLTRKEDAANEIIDSTDKAIALTEIERERLRLQLEDETLSQASRIQLEFDSEQTITQIRATAAAEIAAQEKKKADDQKKAAVAEVKLKKQVEQAKASLVTSGFQLAKALAGKNQKLQKAIGIAETVVNTARGIMNAFATLPYPAAVPAAISVAAVGAAQLITIANSDSGSSGSVSTPNVSSSNSSADTTEADSSQTNREALETAIGNLGLTVSVTEINDVQNSVKVSEQTATI